MREPSCVGGNTRELELCQTSRGKRKDQEKRLFAHLKDFLQFVIVFREGNCLCRGRRCFLWDWNLTHNCTATFLDVSFPKCKSFLVFLLLLFFLFFLYRHVLLRRLVSGRGGRNHMQLHGSRSYPQQPPPPHTHTRQMRDVHGRSCPSTHLDNLDRSCPSLDVMTHLQVCSKLRFLVCSCCFCMCQSNQSNLGADDAPGQTWPPSCSIVEDVENLLMFMARTEGHALWYFFVSDFSVWEAFSGLILLWPTTWSDHQACFGLILSSMVVAYNGYLTKRKDVMIAGVLQVCFFLWLLFTSWDLCLWTEQDRRTVLFVLNALRQSRFAEENLWINIHKLV